MHCLLELSRVGLDPWEQQRNCENVTSLTNTIDMNNCFCLADICAVLSGSTTTLKRQPLRWIGTLQTLVDNVVGNAFWCGLLARGNSGSFNL